MSEQIELRDGARNRAGEDRVTAAWLEDQSPYITLQADGREDDQDPDLEQA